MTSAKVAIFAFTGTRPSHSTYVLVRLMGMDSPFKQISSTFKRGLINMIFAELNQQILRGGQRVPRVVLDKVLKTTSKALGLKGRWGVSIAFVDRRTMRRLNRAYRGQDRVTDVLSFHLGDDRNLGEIILCYDRAATQAKDIGHTVRDEIVFLIVHGLLHLCGYDHTQSKDAKKMFLLQTQILTSLHINTKV